MELKIVAAMCDGNRGMGKNGRLPWPTLKDDMEHYLKLVKKTRDPAKKNITIQGRLTWQEGKKERKSDPHCIQIVISGTYDGSKDPIHPIVVPSIEEAVKVAMAPEMQAKVENIWVIGGQRVWEDTIKHPLCKRIYLTRVYKDFDSDVIFPPFEDKFVKSSDPEIDDKIREENGVQYQFLVYDRK